MAVIIILHVVPLLVVVAPVVVVVAFSAHPLQAGNLQVPRWNHQACVGCTRRWPLLPEAAGHSP